jgi:hypothetical protein
MSVKVRTSCTSPLPSALLVVALVAGCGVAEPDHLVEFEPPLNRHFNDGYLAVNFGETLVDVWAGGQLVGDPVTIAAGAPTSITATFHDAAANMVGGLDQHELTMTPADGGLLRFTPISTGGGGTYRTFRGTLTRVAAGTTTVTVSLRNTSSDLEDFGPFAIPVTVE